MVGTITAVIVTLCVQLKQAHKQAVLRSNPTPSWCPESCMSTHIYGVIIEWVNYWLSHEAVLIYEPHYAL